MSTVNACRRNVMFLCHKL